MITFAQTDPAQDDGVYTLHLTREEGLDVLRALDDRGGNTPASIRAMQRLAARLYQGLDVPQPSRGEDREGGRPRPQGVQTGRA